jgi:hypothetical protein
MRILSTIAGYGVSLKTLLALAIVIAVAIALVTPDVAAAMPDAGGP